MSLFASKLDMVVEEMLQQGFNRGNWDEWKRWKAPIEGGGHDREAYVSATWLYRTHDTELVF
jgi:hypothetical protein